MTCKSLKMCEGFCYLSAIDGQSFSQRPGTADSRQVSALASPAQDPYFLFRQAIDLVLANPKVARQQGIRIPAQPVRQRDLLVHAAVEQNQDLGGLIAYLLDKVSVALLDEGDVPGPELFCFHSSM